MGRLAALVVKEVRELSKERTVLFGLIIMPFLLFSLMGVLVSQSLQRVQEAAEAPVNAAVQPAPDAGEGDRILAAMLASALNATLVKEQADPAGLLEAGYQAVVVVPRGAWGNLTMGLPARVDVYVRVEGLSVAVQARVEAVAARLEAAGRAVLAALLSQAAGANVTPQALASPLAARQTLILEGRPLEPGVFQAMASTLTFTAMAFFVMLVGAVQVAATSMGLERESKTLEMLLATPLTHREIVLGKVLGVALVALAGMASYAAGFAVYLNSLKASGVEELATGFRAEALAYVAPALAATLYTTAALGLIVGMAAQDVRGAQLLGAQTAFLLGLPYFAAFLGMATTGPAALALLADPLYPPIAAAAAGITGDGGLLAASYAASAAHAVAWTLAASKLMSPERLLLGIRLPARLRARIAAG